MFQDVADAGERSPAELEVAYADALRTVIEDRGGPEAVASESGVDAASVAAMADGTLAEVTLAEGAAVLALADDRDADAIVAASRDALLMGMTSAVLDVDALAAAVDGDLDPREIQQKIEGRFPVTLAEYARLHHTIQDRIP